ncbi:MAG: glycosyltransferase family 2 protein [Pedosphaera sp.]|nr:glycosyltransferase family 2 protein [Pedosphaera sp.]
MRKFEIVEASHEPERGQPCPHVRSKAARRTRTWLSALRCRFAVSIFTKHLPVTAPLFSILLPTRNRSEIVADAIRSVLDQTCGDFEIIVSDNDESPTKTRDAVAGFTDARVRYIRTSGNLSMHDNWENAFNQATGDYVFILEDKQRLVPNALEILHHWFKTHGPVVISYDIRFARGERIDAPKLFPHLEKWSSRDAIDHFCRFEQKFFNILPKGLDSCAPRKLLAELKAKSPTGMLYSYISPDYASGFMMLAAVEHFYYTPAPLVYIPNNWMWQGKYSNGQASFKKTESYRRFLQDLPVTREEILRDVPLKSEFLWINSVLYDFFKFYRRPDHKSQIDWPRYYGFCIFLIVMGRKLGADLGEETKLLRTSLALHSFLFKASVLLNLLERGMGIGWQYLYRLLRT